MCIIIALKKQYMTAYNLPCKVYFRFFTGPLRLSSENANIANTQHISQYLS